MSEDLALSRATHDLLFSEIISISASQPVKKYQIWPIDGADKVAQQIKITLLAFLGEWFLDVTFGIPYLEEILVKNPHMASVEIILRNAISDVPNVIRIDSLGLDWDRKTRALLVEFTCTTDLGPIQDSIRLEVIPHYV